MWKNDSVWYVKISENLGFKKKMRVITNQTGGIMGCVITNMITCVCLKMGPAKKKHYENRKNWLSTDEFRGATIVYHSSIFI